MAVSGQSEAEFGQSPSIPGPASVELGTFGPNSVNFRPHLVEFGAVVPAWPDSSQSWATWGGGAMIMERFLRNMAQWRTIATSRDTGQDISSAQAVRPRARCSSGRREAALVRGLALVWRRSGHARRRRLR